MLGGEKGAFRPDDGLKLAHVLSLNLARVSWGSQRGFDHHSSTKAFRGLEKHIPKWICPGLTGTLSTVERLVLWFVERAIAPDELAFALNPP
jgi:hypothetical protein